VVTLHLQLEHDRADARGRLMLFEELLGLEVIAREADRGLRFGTPQLHGGMYCVVPVDDGH